MDDDSSKSFYMKAVSPMDLIVKNKAASGGPANLREERKKAGK